MLKELFTLLAFCFVFVPCPFMILVIPEPEPISGIHEWRSRALWFTHFSYLVEVSFRGPPLVHSHCCCCCLLVLCVRHKYLFCGFETRNARHRVGYLVRVNNNTKNKNNKNNNECVYNRPAQFGGAHSFSSFSFLLLVFYF